MNKSSVPAVKKAVSSPAPEVPAASIVYYVNVYVRDTDEHVDSFAVRATDIEALRAALDAEDDPDFQRHEYQLLPEVFDISDLIKNVDHVEYMYFLSAFPGHEKSCSE